MAVAAFDLAERLQTPVFVMSDLDLGMNIWMSEPFPYPTEAARPRQGARRRRRSTKLGEWGRYKDVDRRRHPVAHAARHRHARLLHARIGPQREGQHSERRDDYQNNLDRLTRKFETAATLVPAPEIDIGRRTPGSASSLSGRRTGRW